MAPAFYTIPPPGRSSTSETKTDVMAVQRHEIVSGEESEIHDEPHLAGRRLPVRTIVAAVEDRGEDPKKVADRHDITVADVYRALTYYYDHPDEMARVERDRRSAERSAREQGVPTIDELADVDGDAQE